jgi:hypothetical protein
MEPRMSQKIKIKNKNKIISNGISEIFEICGL